MPSKLRPRQQIFVLEYVKDFNATRAAIAAGYSPKTARFIASNLLTKVNVKEAVKLLLQEKVMTADEVLTRLADMARGDIAELMELSTMGFTFDLMIKNENGEMVPNPKTKLIKRIKQKVTTFIGKKSDTEDREIIETELELHDSQAALVNIGKHLGLFKDQSMNLNVDLSTLSDEQLDKLASGGDLLSVITNKS